MQKRLRLRFLLLSWGLLMILLSALSGGIAYYLYSSTAKESEEMLKTAMDEFQEQTPAAAYLSSGRYFLAARYLPDGRLIERQGWNFFVEESIVKEIAASTFDKGEEGSGSVVKLGVAYRYRYRNQSDETWFVMTDYSAEQQVMYMLKHNMIWFLILGAVLLIPVSVLLSKWASKPIAEAWEKQNDFVSDATHELKTPLAVIAADTEAVLSNPDASVESQEKWLGSIQGQTSRMAGLVSGLLFLAKIDAHEIKLNLQEERISERVEEFCMEWEVRAFEEGCEFEYEMTHDMIYKCDWQRIEQMLTELMDNALKYTMKGKSIHLVMNRDRKQHLRIVLSNEGEPIDEKELEKLFDRFYRADPSRARETGGYGLGLCVSKCIAELHGGTITAESSNGLNVFTITLGNAEQSVEGQ